MTNLFLCDLELDALEEQLEGCERVEDLQDGLDALGIDMDADHAITCLNRDNFGQCNKCGNWDIVTSLFHCCMDCGVMS